MAAGRQAYNERMNRMLSRLARNSLHRWWVEPAMACRALCFAGGKFTCPCCGWTLRAFTRGGTSFQTRPNGYCPRCNSKARHRRDWLFLKENTNLFTGRLSLLHVSPKYALSRRFAKMANIRFMGVDIERRPYVSRLVDITEIPFEADSFDAVICIHVLEHIEQDRRAISELYRVLKPGGWAVITVPVNLDDETYENPSVIAAEERKKHFGESQHVRIYGADLSDRLRECGFTVTLDLGGDLPLVKREKYGLLDDENVFYCTKS